MRLHYLDHQRTSPNTIVFVHGFPFHGGMWDDQMDALPAGWRGVAPDLRGFGLSTEWGTRRAPLTMEQHAEDVVALLDRLRIERAVFCGLSMGGYVLFALWRRHRERVRGLVLCDTKAGADTEETRRGRRMLAARVEREGAAAVCESMLPKLVSPQTREQDPYVEATLEAMILGTPADTMTGALEGLAQRPDSIELLEEIDVPTLVVVGEEDEITPPGEAELIAARVHGATLVRIPRAGHVSSLENADAFNAALFEFLRAQTAVL